MPQRLIKNSKLTNRQLNELVKYFALEVPASRAAKVMNINRYSAERVFQVIRRANAYTITIWREETENIVANLIADS